MIKISKIPFPKRQYEIISKSNVNFSLVDKREFISNLEANRTGALILKMSIFHQARAYTEVFHK